MAQAQTEEEKIAAMYKLGADQWAQQQREMARLVQSLSCDQHALLGFIRRRHLLLTFSSSVQLQFTVQVHLEASRQTSLIAPPPRLCVLSVWRER